MYIFSGGSIAQIGAWEAAEPLLIFDIVSSYCLLIGSIVSVVIVTIVQEVLQLMVDFCGLPPSAVVALHAGKDSI